MVHANNDLKARVNELNAWLDGLIRPMRGKSAKDWMLINHGANGAMNGQFDGNNASLVSSMTALQCEGLSRGVAQGGISTRKVDSLNSWNVSLMSLTRPSSCMTSVINNFFLNGMECIMNNEVGNGILSRKTLWQFKPKEENMHPNLMD
jgi:hypothetical protein